MQFFYPTVGLAHILCIGRQSGIHSLFFPHLLVREILYRSWCFFLLEQPYIGNKVFNVFTERSQRSWVTYICEGDEDHEDVTFETNKKRSYWRKKNNYSFYVRDVVFLRDD